MKRVPVSSPAITAAIPSGRRPLMMTVVIPASTAILTASSLVIIPPTEKKALLAQKAEDKINTVVRQIAFYDKHHPAWSPWLRAYLRLRGHLPPA